jgi:Flp pilus assembly protein CpaB
MTTTAGRRFFPLATTARLDGRMLLGVALVAASLAGGLIFWGSTRQTVPVLVAARELPAGHVIKADDLAISQVRLDGRLSSLAAPDAERRRVVGRTTGTPIHTGEMVIWPDLATGPLIGPTEAAVTVPVKPEAVYGGLRPGDAVAVIATRGKGQVDSQTGTLLQRAIVYDISLRPDSVSSSDSAASGTTSHQLTNVTLVVPRSETEHLAQAIVNWEITLALLSPQSGGPGGSGP